MELMLKNIQYDIWIPELIFGHLHTSTNYNKNERKLQEVEWFGSLVLIWSTFGSVETVDHIGTRYFQTFENNLQVSNPPKIRKIGSKTDPYTE